MSHATSPRIHPTALISPEAELADDVRVGPFVVIEGRVRIGPGCVLRPYVHLCGPLTMGRGNTVYGGAVIGERPQHLRYNDEETSVEIGDDNVIREHVTIHRGTTHSWTTRIGNKNFLMAHSHVAHDCQVGSQCILANGALLGGHCVVQDNVYLSGNSAVHQFVRVGRLALLSGTSATTKDMPPFTVIQGIDNVVGLNLVGMRRAGMTVPQIDAVRTAFKYLFRAGMIVPAALERIEREMGTIEPVMEMARFIKESKRGINPMRGRTQTAA